MIAMLVFEHSLPAPLIIGAVVAALAVAGFSFWRYVNRDVTALILAALRLLFILGIAWCLLQPSLRHSLTEKLKPRFLVALDTSQSMLLKPSDLVPTRWTTALSVFDMSWRRAIGAECEIDLYPFNADLGPREQIARAPELTANGLSTLLRDSLRKLNDRYRGQNVGGLLLLTDGLDTREVYNDWVNDTWPWPVFILQLEPDSVWDVEPDVRVDAVNTPRRVNVEWSTTFRALVSGQGTAGQPISVQILRDNVLLKEEPTLIAAEGGSREVVFDIEHPEVGSFMFKIHIPPLLGESHTNDNSYSVAVQVVDAKNRLLYVEGPPRWESKFLTRALKASKAVTPMAFIRGPNQQFLTLGVQQKIAPDMTESMLANYKIVILGNLNAVELGEERARNLAKFVENGGSLILLGGPNAWGPAGFTQSPLANILPVKSLEEIPEEGSFPVTLTDDGRSHPAFLGEEDFWQNAPPVLSVFPKAKLSAGASSLITANTPEGPAHVIVTHRHGQGKVVAILTDSLWKWQLNPNPEKPYQRFWEQLLSWLTPSEEELDKDQIEIFADREQLFLGEELELSARMGSKKDQPPPNAVVRCEIVTPDKRQMPFAMSSQNVVSSSGQTFAGYVTKYPAQMAGLHTAVAVAEFGGKRISSSPLSFYVKPFTPESIPKPSNTAALRALAKNSGGRYFENAEDLNRHLSNLRVAATEEERVEINSMWNTRLIIACLMALLSIEWVVRKWKHMP